MSSFPVLSMVCVIMLLHFSSATASDATLQTYIVHVELPDEQVSSDESLDLESYYQSFMPTTTAASSESPRRIIFSYRHVFPGFAAKLTADDVKEMSNKSGFIMANPEEIIPLHTTHSPEFLGLQKGTGFWEDSHYGNGTIIAVLDSGFTPDHPSFDDAGMPPPPPTWKGTCDAPITCNNKIIGARSFVPSDPSPKDKVGHGTHTASTAAGSPVDGANVSGNANGTAVGIAPKAHLAIYKVCEPRGCRESSIIAGMDQAIEDKVDIMSISLGGDALPYYRDSRSIAAYSAMKKNIMVICSAGNLGPDPRTVSNEASWIMTVAASTMDRKIVANVVLQNGQVLNGQYLNQPNNEIENPLVLVYPFDPTCRTLSPTMVRSSVVVCEQSAWISPIQQGQNVKDRGGVAMIYTSAKKDGDTISPPFFTIAATVITYEDGQTLKAYYKSARLLNITFDGTQFGDKNAPTIASFSSRGPGLASPNILKPDITAPGVNILAAWPYSIENNPNTKKNFNIISGTSMACPHVSGVAALIKSKHPDWSPAAIKSAIITTADVMNRGGEMILDQTHHTADPFATGAGHINPTRASDPGLVYDIAPIDYLPYLCDLGYTSAQIKRVTGETYSCPTQREQLNLPSIIVRRTLSASTQTITRMLTNVGEDANETYMVTVSPPQGVQVNVVPGTLTFAQVGQKLQYKATFTQVGGTSGTSSGHITWTSDKHSVRSPIVAYQRNRPACFHCTF